MGRTVFETQAPDTTVTTVQEHNLQQLAQAGQQASIAQAAVMDSFEVIKSIGIIDASIFTRQVAEKIIAETAINIRNSKKYNGLPYIDENGNTRQVAGFEEFCQVFLGKSVRRVQELMSNYNQLGPELYEQAEKLGFRQRDYNALKALPDDDKQLIAQAIEEESLDKALDLMQEMAAKFQRDKEASKKQIENLQQTAEAKDALLASKNKKIDELGET